MKIKRKTLNFLRVFILWFGVSSVVFGVIYGYWFTRFFAVTTYDVRGIDAQTQAVLLPKLQEESMRKSYKMFPHDKIFTYSTEAITDVTRNTIPELSQIEVHPVGLHTVRITVSLLSPFFRLDNAQAVTEDGVIFSTMKDTGMYPLLTFSTTTVGHKKNNGLMFTYASQKDTALLLTIKELSVKVSSIIFPVDHIVISDNGDLSFLDVRGISKVVFTQDSDFKKTWSTLVSAIDTEPLKTKLATDKEALLYLDVRYGNKVFYRFSDMSFQNGTSTGILEHHDKATSATTTATTSTH